jgi:hypothetical protein
MATKVLFKSHVPSIKMINLIGKELIFIAGRLVTENEEDIAFLREEIKKGQPHVFEGETAEIDSVQLANDPLEGLKAKLRAELLAEMNVDTAGTTAANPLVPQLKGLANSKTIADGAAGSGA